MPEIGDTYFNKVIDCRGVSPHLWIVISDPKKDPENIVMVNITTHLDNALRECLLFPSDYPSFIKEPSYVHYKEAQLTNCDAIKYKIDESIFEQRPAISPETLRKLLSHAARSKFIPRECRRTLQKQGLIK